MSRSKRWCVTINNPSEPYDATFVLEGNVTHAVWQLERGTTTHIQGYVEVSSKLRRTSMLALNSRGHWTIARGTAIENKVYCTKEDTREAGPWEIGSPMQQGERLDLEATRIKIVEGATNKELAEINFGQWCRNYRAFNLYRQEIQPVRTWKTKVYVITGPTDIGKSYYVFHKAPNAFRQQNKQWFSLYQGQKDVVFDEFYGSRFSYSYLLQLLDEFPMTVETKGGEVNFAPERIWITSNAIPELWYPNMDFKPLRRRLTYVMNFPCDMERIDSEKLDEVFQLD